MDLPSGQVVSIRAYRAGSRPQAGCRWPRSGTVQLARGCELFLVPLSFEDPRQPARLQGFPRNAEAGCGLILTAAGA